MIDVFYYHANAKMSSAYVKSIHTCLLYVASTWRAKGAQGTEEYGGNISDLKTLCNSIPCTTRGSKIQFSAGFS